MGEIRCSFSKLLLALVPFGLVWLGSAMLDYVDWKALTNEVGKYNLNQAIRNESEMPKLSAAVINKDWIWIELKWSQRDLLEGESVGKTKWN